MWPILAGEPVWPRWSSPPATTPPPMPVPSVTSIMSVGRPCRRRAATRRAPRTSRRCRRGRGPSSCAEQPAGDVEVGDAVEVGGRAQHTAAGHQSRARRPRASSYGPSDSGQLDQRVDQLVDAARAAWCRPAVLADHVALGVERHAEALRPADVDADVRPDPSRGPRHASACALSSLMALRIRRSARRLTKPGQRHDELDGEVVAHLRATVGRRCSKW